jgi:transcriptional regulator GlxA family with amidase domain
MSVATSPVCAAPPRQVALLVYEGIQVLDVTEPAAVFAAANDACGALHYQVHILSREGGLVQSNSAPVLWSEPLRSLTPAAMDTVLLSGGGPAVAALVADEAAAEWLRTASAHCRRLGAICTGAFGLAELGLLDGKRVATHWGACAELARRYPQLQVDANSLYVQDGKVWTSAGVSTGIDMCLAMVSADLGEAVSTAIAKRLVLYAKRPGHQSQFSQLLAAQSAAGAPFGELVEWMRERLREPLDVPRLAERMAMSNRNFHRRFTARMGETPARFVEDLRLESARQMLAAGQTLKQVAMQTGYTSAGQLAKAFERRIGMAPSLFQALHQTS